MSQDLDLFVFEADEWVSEHERRRICVSTFTVVGALVAGFAVYVWGLAEMLSRGPHAWLALMGLSVMSGAAVVAIFALTYRRTGSTVPVGSTIFHVSTASWPAGTVVTLDPARRKRPAIVTNGWHVRLVGAIYFFPRRPTFKHVRSQSLSGKGSADRYAYELRLLRPIASVYEAGAARFSTEDLLVEVMQASRLVLKEAGRHRERMVRKEAAHDG